ncbi:hypothetical protein EON65_11570 [archaeon]|nr:MAG: hypothetical protein EON65_11570 [archaeon]
MQAQFVLEVQRFKLSKHAYPSKDSKRVIIHLEGQYRNKVIKSSEYVVNTGTQVALPWSSRLDKITLRFYCIDERLKVEVGSCEYELDKKFDQNGKPCSLLLRIFPRGGETLVGKILCTVSVKYLYDDGKPHNQQDQPSSHAEVGKQVGPTTDMLQYSLPGFRFKRLSKIINWTRVRSVDVDKIASKVDVHKLRSFMDDVALGDAEMEGKCMDMCMVCCMYVFDAKPFHIFFVQTAIPSTSKPCSYPSTPYNTYKPAINTCKTNSV